MATYSSAHFKNECLRSEDLRSHLLLFERRAAPDPGYACDGSGNKLLQWDKYIYFHRALGVSRIWAKVEEGESVCRLPAPVFATAPPSCSSAAVNPQV